MADSREYREKLKKPKHLRPSTPEELAVEGEALDPSTTIDSVSVTLPKRESPLNKTCLGTGLR